MLNQPNRLLCKSTLHVHLKEIEMSEDYQFLSTFASNHKKKLYASLVLKNLHMQLHHSSVDIARSVSDEPKSIFINMLKANTQYDPEESR